MFRFVLLIIVRQSTSIVCVFLLMIRRPPRSTLDRSAAASDVYKRQDQGGGPEGEIVVKNRFAALDAVEIGQGVLAHGQVLSLIHISEPTRPY